MRTAPALYEDVLAIIKAASHEADTSAVLRQLDELGFQKVAATNAKFHEGYLRTEGYDSVFVQYRYYDTSKAFSIRPDMNVFLVKLLSQYSTLKESTLKEEEIRFLDKT